MYSEESQPAHLFTLDQLRERRLLPGDIEDAVLYSEKAPGWICLYDIEKARHDSTRIYNIAQIETEPEFS